MKNDIAPDLIFYGGTFDPPHMGHLQCLQNVMNQFVDTEVMVAPGYQPAGQLGKHKTPKASFDDRYEMSKLAFENIGKGQLQVSAIEREMPRPNYTLQVLDHLQKNNINQKIALFVGQDQIKGFDRWKEPEEILRKYSVVVAKRNTGEMRNDSLMKDCITILKKMNLEYEINEENQQVKIIPYGTFLHLIDADICEAESTSLRGMMQKNKEKTVEGWLPEAVEKYIKTNNLYI